MDMPMILVFVLFLFVPGLGGWAGEVLLLEADTHITVEAVHTTPYHTHILYSVYQKEGYSLYYSLVEDSTLTLLNKKLIAKNVTAGSLVADPATNSVLVAFTADTDYKEGILGFVESKDGGWSWGSVREVAPFSETPKSSPIVVYQKETDRVFVFYYSDNNDEGKTATISMVTKPRNSLIFTNEKRIYKTSVKSYKFAATYTFSEEHGARLHLHWANILSNPGQVVNSYYSYSNTQGLTWKEPKNLFTDLLYPFLSLKNSDFGIILATALDAKGSTLRYSQDMGITWTEPLIFDIGYGRDTVVCTYKEQVHAFILMSNIYGTVYENLQLGNDKAKKEKSPFDEKQEWRYDIKPHLLCQTDEKIKTRVTAIVARSLRGKYQLIINHKDYPNN